MSGCLSQLTQTYYVVDEIQAADQFTTGGRYALENTAPASLVFPFAFYPNLHTPGSWRVVSSQVAASPSCPLADRCLPASSPISARPLIYSPELQEQGLLRPDCHLAFGINLERDKEPRVNGLPHLVCVVWLCR